MSEDQDDQDQAPKIGGDMETLFILDLFKYVNHLNAFLQYNSR